MISESNESNQAIASYVWGPDRMLANRDANTNQKYYYLYNGHGDVVQIIAENGTTVNICGQHIQMYNNRDIVQMDMGGYDLGWNIFKLGFGSTITRKFKMLKMYVLKMLRRKILRFKLILLCTVI